MPTTTTRNGLRKPLSTEAPDGAGQIGNLADDIEQYLGGAGVEYAANLQAIQAIPAARLYTGKRAIAADSAAMYRWNGTKWQVWNWSNVPTAEYQAQFVNGASADTNGGNFDLSVDEGVSFLNFNLYRSAGFSQGTVYFQTTAAYRPQFAAHGGGSTFGSQTGIGSFLIDSSGQLSWQGATVSAASALRGSLFWRNFN